MVLDFESGLHAVYDTVTLTSPLQWMDPMKSNDTSPSADIGEHVDSLLDLFGDGIYISDRWGTTLKVNRMYEEMTGLLREELVGRNVTELKRQGVYDTALNPEVVRSKKPQSSVQVIRNGRKVVLNAYPVFDRKNQVAFVVTFVRDITVMAQLKAEIHGQKQLIAQTHRKLKEAFREKASAVPMVAQSHEYLDLLKTVRKIAATDVPVLLLGETGVGKDLLARHIHENSLRGDELFIKVDCAGIPQNLVESELFGYAPGAFSGASKTGKLGLLEVADGGTLLLDEIGELPLSLQAKLLRFIQDYEIVKVGSTRAKRIDVRILASTNRDLQADVAKGRFRKDLYYRLQVAVLSIPALRERKEDILPLAEAFVERSSLRYKKNITLSQGAAALLRDYRWPGNVRELENLIRSLVVTSEKDLLTADDLPGTLLPSGHRNAACGGFAGGSKAGLSLKEIVSEFEKRVILDALASDGSVSAAARRLGVDRTTLFRKMKRYRTGEEK